MCKKLTISEVRAHLPKLIARVAEHDKEIVVMRNGRPAAVLVSHKAFERLRATLDVLSDSGLMRQIELSRAFYAAGRK